MTPNLEVSAKRILFFTKVILTFFVISLLIFLNYVDLQESNRNKAYLCMLRDVHKLSDDADLQFKDYELERISWLRAVNPALQKRHTDSRVELVNLLSKYGAFIDAPSKGMNKTPNSIVLMISSQDTITQKSGSDEDPPREIVVIGYSSAVSNANVSMALDSFKKYESPEKVYMLTDIDSALLVQKLDSLLSLLERRELLEANILDSIKTRDELTLGDTIAERFTRDGANRHGVKVDVSGTGGPDAFQPLTEKEALFKKYQTFNGLFLHGSNVYISISDARPGWGGPGINIATQSGIQGNVGAGITHYFITAPVQNDSAMFPSTLQFAGLDTAIVRGLAHNKRKQQELNNLYGSYNLDFIDNLSIEAFNKNNNSVSILGFDISRKWFPIAMFLVLIGIYAMLYKTIQKAALSSSKIISGYMSEETLDFLIDNKLIRFIIWVLTPLFLLFFVLYSTLIQYSVTIYTGLLLAGILCFLLGWLSYKKSLKL